MNHFIEEQLKKCTVAEIPNFDTTTTQILINGKRKEAILKFYKYYHIELENYIINPPPNFDLADNWNNGTHPTDAEMNIEIIQATDPDLSKAKMLKISGRCEPSGQLWTGWVPKKSIIKFEEL